MGRKRRGTKKTTTTHRRSSLAGGVNPNPGSNEERRDWPSLPRDIVLTVSDQLFSDDLTHYVRFRSICSAWRKSTRDPSAIPADFSFRPKNWIPVKCDRLVKPLARPETKDWICFLNICTGKYVRVCIPELESGFRVMFIVDSCLLLLNPKSIGICLLNPFTRSVAELPSVISLKRVTKLRGNLNVKKFLSDVKFLPSSQIVLFFSRLNKVVYAKPGEQHWLATKTNIACFCTLYFKSQLFAVTRLGRILQLDLDSQNDVKTLFERVGKRVYLVKCDGQFLVIWHYVDPLNRQKPHVEIQKIDINKRFLMKTRIPFGYALVISASAARCMSISTAIFPCLQSGSIYLDVTCQGAIRNSICIYSLKSKVEVPRIRPLQYCLIDELLYTKNVLSRCEYYSEQHCLVDNLMSYLENSVMHYTVEC